MLTISTGSQNEWVVTLNATRAHYRATTQHIEKGPPYRFRTNAKLLGPSGAVNPIARRRNLEKSAMLFLHLNKQVSIASSIQAWAIARFAKYDRKTSSTPSITKYKYMQPEEEWVHFLTDPSERDKRDRPVGPPPCPMRMNVEPPETGITDTTTENRWSRAVSGRTRSIGERDWAFGLYSIVFHRALECYRRLCGIGEMPYSRRFSLPCFFVCWTWIMGQSNSSMEFVSHAHQNAKLVRTLLSQSIQVAQEWGPVFGYLLRASGLIYVYPEMRRWVFGKPIMSLMGMQTSAIPSARSLAGMSRPQMDQVQGV